MSREGVRIVLGDSEVRVAKSHAENGNVIPELAAIAGSIYFWAGLSNYQFSRQMFGKRYDFPGANVSFFGVEVKTKGEIWEQVLKIKEADRRRGWIYFAVAVSPIQTRGERVAAATLICGYVVDALDKAGDLEVPFLATTAPLPILFQGVTDDGTRVGWPDDTAKRPWSGNAKRT